MGATAADVQLIRNEVQQLKNDMSTIDVQYRKYSAKRIEGQQKLAGISQKVQEVSKDVLLVEDIVVITLASETSAKLSLPEMNNPADTRQVQTMPSKVSSADEAITLYTQQKVLLTQDIEYRTLLCNAERTMVNIYEKSIQEMVTILNEYCTDKNLRSLATKIAGV